jgi:hypothetical protein
MEAQSFHENILRFTGGLPPLAFTLQPVLTTAPSGSFFGQENVDITPIDVPMYQQTDSELPLYCPACGFPGCFGVDCRPGVRHTQQIQENTMTQESYTDPTCDFLSVQGGYEQELEASEEMEDIAISAPLAKSGVSRKEHKGSRLRLAEDTKLVLEDHFEKQPYPELNDLQGLAHITRLSIKQLRTWFTNTRTRRLKKGMFV